MIPTEKPGTPAELVHHGVKGQKWGVRRARAKQVRAQFTARNPTRQQRNAAILRARSKVRTSGKNVTFEQRAIAARMTTGEKVVLGLLATTGVATLPVAAFVGARMTVRQNFEKRA